MKRIKVILFVFSLLVIMPKVNAKCEYDEKSKLQALASNLNFSYNYTETENGVDSTVDFSVTITNVVPELYIVDQTNIKVYHYNNNKEIIIKGYSPGTTIEFIIYGNTNQCKATELLTNYITLPSYNRFYKDPICDGVSNYKLCNRWTRVDLTYDDFLKKVMLYKEQTKVEPNPVIAEPSFAEKIIVFLSKYSFYLFGGIIVICLILIIYLKRKDDFDLS